MLYFRKIMIFIFISITFLMASEQKFLKPNEAFKTDLTKNGKNITINIGLGKKIYLYKDKLHVELTKPTKQNLDELINFPKSVYFHDNNVYREDINITITQSIINRYVTSGEYELRVSWQGCSEAGLCYQPMKKSQKFSFGDDTKNSNLSEQDLIAKSFETKGFFLILVSFFGFGLLLSLTPCILPMIPILSSIIVSQSGEKMDAKKGFLLSLAYVLGMSLAYSIAGVLAAYYGVNVKSELQNPYVLFSFSGIFVLLALSMFGFYEIRLPQKWQSLVNKKSDKFKNKGIFGIAIMGFLSALIVSPCVATPLVGALIYIVQTGDVVLGGSALFLLGIGMGIPLLIMGSSEGKLLPKPGIWMDRIKAIFGVIMLIIAIWIIRTVISPVLYSLLRSMILISSAIYMGVFESSKNGWSKLLKSFAFIVLLYGSIMFTSAILIYTYNLDISSRYVTPLQTKQNKSLHVKTLEQLNEQIQNSKKPILIDFWATWCESCTEMEEITFENEAVKSELEKFNIIRIDVTNNTDEDKKILDKYGLFGPPGIIFYKNKKELKNLRVVGFKNPDDFLDILKKVQNE